jgi:hypothetical protein
MRGIVMRSRATRITLTRRELMFVKSFIANASPGTETDRLLNKLKGAISRIDGAKKRFP